MKPFSLNFFQNRKPQFKSVFKLGLILCVVMIGLSYYANSKIKQKLSKIVGLQCEKIDVSIFFRKANLSDLSYQWSKTNSDTSNIFCKNISLNGIKWWALLVHKQLKINELYINNIQGEIVQAIAEENKSSTTKNKKPQLNSISIKNIFLDKINIEYTKRKHFFTKMEDFNLQLNQLEYDLSQPLNAINYKGFDCSLKKGSWIPVDGNYAIHCESLDGNMNAQSLFLKGLELKPLHSKKNWYKHFKHKNARLGLKTSDITATEINYRKLLNGEGVTMKNLALENLDLEVYIDKKLLPCTDCYKPFIHEKLLALKLPITIDLVELKNNKIDIETFNEEGVQTAKVDFQKIYASIYNVTNEIEKIKQSPQTIAEVKTMFLGKENLNAKIVFNLNDNLNGYLIEGEMENIDLTLMNDILKFGTKAKIKSGILKQLNFKLDGNQDVATGNMAFHYENLEIEILNQEKSKAKKLISKLVNKIGIKEDNAVSEGNFKEGKIYYKRRKNKGLFHQWWRAILSGFQSTIMPNVILPDELDLN